MTIIARLGIAGLTILAGIFGASAGSYYGEATPSPYYDDGDDAKTTSDASSFFDELSENGN